MLSSQLGPVSASYYFKILLSILPGKLRFRIEYDYCSESAGIKLQILKRRYISRHMKTESRGGGGVGGKCSWMYYKSKTRLQGRRSVFLSGGGGGGGAENERRRREFVGGSGGIPPENFEI